MLTNFIICAPSGLKSSVIPSLKSIRDFDATWILPSEAVKQIKDILKFEILDEDKTGNKSNRVKNPNVQKIATHQPFDSLIGLVMVTNAEKVILDNIRVDKKSGQLTIDNYTENEKAMNELKKFIAKIPHLAVLVDEVHHLADENIKLNSVVEYWKLQGNMNCLIGFSGTPYYNTKQPIYVSDQFSYGVTQIPFVVNHYPLISAIETFLKKPLLIKTDNRDYLYIIEKGLKDFFDKYKETVYKDGTCAKVAIYCGRIAKLREEVYQKCSEIAISYGLNPDEAILCYHGDDSKSNYTCSAREKEEWTLLDNIISKVRIILLAQIGKEGWNCKSLTGVILSQEGDCPRNMILQTTCRCLRQVDKNNNEETALICLNDYNYKVWWLNQKKYLGDRLGNTDRLFCPEDGTDISPGLFRVWLQKTLAKVDLPKVTLHSLRHTNITLQLVAGVDMKTVSARAGHSKASTTSDFYSHFIKNSDIHASEILNKIFE